jgi:hypothetical protein
MFGIGKRGRGLRGTLASPQGEDATQITGRRSVQKKSLQVAAPWLRKPAIQTIKTTYTFSASFRQFANAASRSVQTSARRPVAQAWHLGKTCGSRPIHRRNQSASKTILNHLGCGSDRSKRLPGAKRASPPLPMRRTPASNTSRTRQSCNAAQGPSTRPGGAPTPPDRCRDRSRSGWRRL